MRQSKNGEDVSTPMYELKDSLELFEYVTRGPFLSETQCRSLTWAGTERVVVLIKSKLHYIDLLWICHTICYTTNKSTTNQSNGVVALRPSSAVM